jgi:hypothetical protein
VRRTNAHLRHWFSLSEVNSPNGLLNGGLRRISAPGAHDRAFMNGSGAAAFELRLVAKGDWT